MSDDVRIGLDADLNLDTTRAEADLKRLQDRALEAFQKLPGGAMAPTYQTMQTLQAGNPKDFQAIAQSSPQLAKALRDIDQYTKTGRRPESIRDYDSAEDRRLRYEDLRLRRQEAQRWQMADRGSVAPTTFSQRLLGSMRGGMAFNAISAMASGDVETLSRSFSRALVTTLLTPSAGSPRGYGAGTLGGIVSARMAAASGADAGTVTAAAASGGILSSIGNALGGLLGPIGIGAGALGVGYLAFNSQQAKIYQEQRDLIANTGNYGGDSSGLLGHVLDSTHRYLYEPSVGLQAATTLGQAGVQGADLGTAVQNTLAVSRLSGADPKDIAGIVGKMAVAGGMNQEDIAKTFQAMEQQTKLTNIPLSRLIDNLKILGQTSGDAALTTGNINGMAAVQSILGMGISSSQFLSTAQSATGASALTMAASLGLTPNQFSAIQNNQAPLFDQISKSVRRMFGKLPAGHGRIDLAENWLQQTGLANLAGIAPGQLDKVLNNIFDNNTGAAIKAANIGKGEYLTTGGDFRDKVAGLAGNLVSDADKAKLEAMYFIQNQVNHMSESLDRIAAVLAPLPTNASATKEQLLNDMKNLGAGGLPDAGNPSPGSGNGYVSVGPTMNSVDSIDPVTGKFYQYKYQKIRRTLNPNEYGGPDLSMAQNLGFAVNPGHGESRANWAHVHGELANWYSAMSAKYHIPISVLLAQDAHESNFDPTLSATDGGMGIAQFMGGTFAWLNKRKDSPFYGKKFDPYNPEQAVELQSYYLQYLLKRDHGNMRQAVADYNSGSNGPTGPGSYSDTVLKDAQTITVQVEGVMRAVDNTGTTTHTGKVDPTRTKVGARQHVKGQSYR